MGYMQAAGFAEAVDDGMISLDMALSIHLSSNHYPPIPQAWIPACKSAIQVGIEAALEEDWDLLDAEITVPGLPTRTARWLIEGAHLDAFIEQAVDSGD